MPISGLSKPSGRRLCSRGNPLGEMLKLSQLFRLTTEDGTSIMDIATIHLILERFYSYKSIVVSFHVNRKRKGFYQMMLTIHQDLQRGVSVDPTVMQ